MEEASPIVPTGRQSAHGRGSVSFAAVAPSSDVPGAPPPVPPPPLPPPPESPSKEANIDCGNDDDDESADALAKDDEGAAHFKQGNYDEALESYQEALAIKSRIQNAAPENKTNIVSIAYTLCNMAAVYEKQRRFDLAVEKLEKALTSKESNTSRISESSIAVTLSNLGDVHKKIAVNARDEELRAKHYNEAKKYYESALKKKQETNGENDLSSAATLDNLGILHLYKKEYTEAVRCFRKALKIKEGAPDSDDSCRKRLAVAATFSNMGVAHDKQGDYKEAEECHSKALMIKKSVLEDKTLFPQVSCEEEYSSIALTLGNLGTLRCNMNKGKYDDQARRHYEEALEYYHRLAHDTERSQVAHTWFSLGSLHERKGKPTYYAALHCYEEALKIRRDIKDHAAVARSERAVKRVKAFLSTHTTVIFCPHGIAAVKFAATDAAQDPSSDAAQDPSAPWKLQCQTWMRLCQRLSDDLQTPSQSSPREPENHRHAEVLKSHVKEVDGHPEKLQNQILVCRVIHRKNNDSQPFCVELKVSSDLWPAVQAVITTLVNAGSTVSFFPVSNATQASRASKDMLDPSPVAAHTLAYHSEGTGKQRLSVQSASAAEEKQNEVEIEAEKALSEKKLVKFDIFDNVDEDRIKEFETSVGGIQRHRPQQNVFGPLYKEQTWASSIAYQMPTSSHTDRLEFRDELDDQDARLLLATFHGFLPAILWDWQIRFLPAGLIVLIPPSVLHQHGAELKFEIREPSWQLPVPYEPRGPCVFALPELDAGLTFDDKVWFLLPAHQKPTGVAQSFAGHWSIMHDGVHFSAGYACFGVSHFCETLAVGEGPVIPAHIELRTIHVNGASTGGEIQLFCCCGDIDCMTCEKLFTRISKRGCRQLSTRSLKCSSEDDAISAYSDEYTLNEIQVLKKAIHDVPWYTNLPRRCFQGENACVGIRNRRGDCYETWHVELACDISGMNTEGSSSQSPSKAASPSHGSAPLQTTESNHAVTKFVREIYSTGKFNEATRIAVELISLTDAKLLAVVGSAGDTRYVFYCDFDIDQPLPVCTLPPSADELDAIAQQVQCVARKVGNFQSAAGSPAIFCGLKAGSEPAVSNITEAGLAKLIADGHFYDEYVVTEDFEQELDKLLRDARMTPEEKAEKLKGQLVWTIDEVLAGEKPYRLKSAGRPLKITLRDAILDSCRKHRHPKIDVCAEIDGIFMEVTTMLKIGLKAASGTRLSHEWHAKDVRGLHVKVCNYIRQRKSMKAAKRVVTLHRIQDPENKLGTRIDELYSLFEDHAAALVQVASFLDTLYMMSELNHKDASAVLEREAARLLNSVFGKLGSIAVQGCRLPDPIKDAMASIRKQITKTVRHNLWISVKELSSHVLDFAEDLTTTWLQVQKINLEDMANTYVKSLSA